MGWLSRARRMVRRHPVWAVTLAFSIFLGGGGALWASRLSSQGRQRTLLALRFAQNAKELETGLAYESLLPPHDLTPLLDRMTVGLEAIRQDMEHLGPEAKGPGNLALGRGYLAMNALEPALEALETAWNAGYRTSDVAYALCKAHCEYFIRILDQLQLGDAPSDPPSLEWHLGEARRFLGLSGGATLEWPELCRAKLLIFERRGAEALEEVRRVVVQDPWCHEAKVEEAYALESLGYDLQRAGDFAGALAWYRRAEEATVEARSVGRSDVTCYLAALDWRLHWLENPGLRPGEALVKWAECERLVDVVLAIRPRLPRAISAKVHVLLGRARVLRALGGDPRHELARAEHYLAGVHPLPGFGDQVLRKRDLIRRTREELGYCR
jgi:serine/threonine-protein kinase